MKRFLCGLGVFSVLGLMAAGCVAGDPAVDEDELTDEAAVEDLAPTGRGIGTIFNHASESAGIKPTGEAGKGSAKPTSNGISYHGGPVMTAPINVYYIWYGNWSDASAKSILTDWASNVGGSPWWNINTTYTNGSGVKTSASVTLAGQTSNNYSNGTSLSDAAIQTIVANSINSGALPKDANGIYLVLTSPDVTATSGFCTQYCGWHTYASIGGVNIKYSFVGNPATQCLSSCSMYSTGPNGNPGVDAMVSIVAHEVAEAATDPQLNAWYDTRGYENADKCAWTFGTTYNAPNGAKANVHLGSRDYLVQQNWKNASGGACTMTYP